MVKVIETSMFEFVRGEKNEYSVIVVSKGGEFHSFGRYKLPAKTTKEVALAFFKDAKRAADVQIEKKKKAANG